MNNEVFDVNETRYLNFSRVISTIAVVILHVLVNPSVQNLDYYTEVQLFFVIFIRNFFIWCVPFFCMISGVLFLNPAKKIPFLILLKKYIFRIFCALLLFGTFFALIELVYVTHVFRINFILKAIFLTLEAKSWDHLWYLYMIIGLYAIVPVLKIFVEHSDNRTFVFIMLVLFVFTSLIPTIEIVIGTKLNYHLPTQSVYILYFLLGYAVHHRNFLMPRIFFFFVILLYISALIFSQFIPVLNDYSSISLKLFRYESPLCVFFSWGLFSFFRKYNLHIRFIDSLSSYCFGIYLLHMFFINFFTKFFNWTLPSHDLLISSLLMLFSSFVLSLMCVYVLKKNPIYKKNSMILKIIADAINISPVGE